MVRVAEVIKREFAARKVSFQEFCWRYAVTEMMVTRYLEGEGRLNEEVARELAEAVGLTPRRLEALAA